MYPQLHYRPTADGLAVHPQIKGFLLEWLKMGAAVSAAFGRVAPPPWAPEALSLGRGPYPLLWHFRATDARPEYWLIPLYDGGAWPEQAVLLWEDGCPRVRLDSRPPHRSSLGPLSRPPYRYVLYHWEEAFDAEPWPASTVDLPQLQYNRP